MDFDQLELFSERLQILDCSSVKHAVSNSEKGRAFRIDATTLFCDLGGTTNLVYKYDKFFAIWLLKMYIDFMFDIGTRNNGVIVGFEGDGLLILFDGPDAEQEAIKCALEMNWFVKYPLQQKVAELFPTACYDIGHVVGIDSSSIVFCDAGPASTEYPLCVGTSINNAANLTTIYDPNFSIFVTHKVWERCYCKDIFTVWNSEAMSQYGELFASQKTQEIIDL